MQVFHKVLNPLLPYDTTLSLLPIAWSGIKDTNDFFNSNHFVSLVHCSRKITPQMAFQYSHVQLTKYQTTPRPKHASTISIHAQKQYTEISQTPYLTIKDNAQDHFTCFDKLPNATCIYCDILILTQTHKVVHVTSGAFHY